MEENKEIIALGEDVLRAMPPGWKFKVTRKRFEKMLRVYKGDKNFFLFCESERQRELSRQMLPEFVRSFGKQIYGRG